MLSPSTVVPSAPSRIEGRPGPAKAAILNAMTVDVEDYFQVSAFDGVIPRSAWPVQESRVCRSTDRLLEIFDEAGVRATFFVLGWVAERFPELVRRIAGAGHELASHGYEHRLVYALEREAFRRDLTRAKDAIEAATGTAVVGFRAPSYSITRESMWALDILIEEGYLYDASIYPIRHDRYGIPEWERHIHRLRRPTGALWELPGATIRIAGSNLPVGGGGYFRLLPYGWTQRGIRRLNHAEGQPAVFYLHPWELDPEQPRLSAGRLTTFRHYRNLGRTANRLRRLLGDFSFGRIADVLLLAERSPQAVLSGQNTSRVDFCLPIG